MDLDSIVIKNLGVLASLKENDNLIVYENSLNVNNETDFQDLNNNDIKNTIISTLLFCLQHDCSLRFKDRILDRIDISIGNIYENLEENAWNSKKLIKFRSFIGMKDSPMECKFCYFKNGIVNRAI